MPKQASCASPPWFAPLYDPFMQPIERKLLGPLRARLLEGLSGHVLELGAGTGANFPLLASAQRQDPALQLSAIEPDPAMRERASRRAEAEGLQIRLVEAPAEALPFADGAFDAVVVTLVLCSVADLEASLAEIRRVLRPGGELRYLEHVRGEGLGGWMQDRLRPAWSCIGAGCQLNRRTAGAIPAAGFMPVTQETLEAPFPILRVIVGTAQRPS